MKCLRSTCSAIRWVCSNWYLCFIFILAFAFNRKSLFSVWIYGSYSFDDMKGNKIVDWNSPEIRSILPSEQYLVRSSKSPKTNQKMVKMLLIYERCKIYNSIGLYHFLGNLTWMLFCPNWYEMNLFQVKCHYVYITCHTLNSYLFYSHNFPWTYLFICNIFITLFQV